MINSQGKPVSLKHLADKAKEQAYINEVIQILNKRDSSGGIMTPELLKEYKEILLKYEVIHLTDWKFKV